MEYMTETRIKINFKNSMKLSMKLFSIFFIDFYRLPKSIFFFFSFCLYMEPQKNENELLN